ncbi:rhodanese-related sulfurtransferase [Rhodopirellula bahusiensis]|uniref:oxygen-dependent tRNA uridine(34) hydroxylase TrhO n=1 Tax=Rhodopirellula bahusiensis TaxID=2014065 RepID=UPI003264B890
MIESHASSVPAELPAEAGAADLPVAVAALYCFTPLPQFESLREPLRQRMASDGIRGSLLLAGEGINGTISGPRELMEPFIEWLRSMELDDQATPFRVMDVKWSFCEQVPFRKTKVRLKREIVTMGVSSIDPLRSVGTYIEPQDWNALVDDPDVTLIDTRNDYEIEIGTFEGAVNPHTESFREFPHFVEENLDPKKHPKVAMFCTGGIRCEKSTAYLKERGFEEVYHLRGGILNYLEKMPEEESRWQGECFVFDNRVAVDHQLQAGAYELCHGCGWPLTPEMKQHSDYERGVACSRCAADVTDDQRKRRRMRQQQLDQGV